MLLLASRREEQRSVTLRTYQAHPTRVYNNCGMKPQKVVQLEIDFDWYTSDPHYGHENVIKYCNRPFRSIGQMDRVFINNWNELVKPTDKIAVIGDFSLSMKPVLDVTPQLNGEKYLFVGNHDKCWPRKPVMWEKVVEYKAAGWHEVYIEAINTITLNGKRVQIHMAHLPYKPGEAELAAAEGYELRYLDQRPEDEGKILLHGHVHQHWKLKGRMLNVGVDVWDYKPASKVQIEEILRDTLG